MLIYSHDGKTIIKAKSLTIQKKLAGKKDEKFAITAWSGEISGVSVALFPDEKTALDALEKVFAAFEGGAKTYRFQ